MQNPNDKASSYETNNKDTLNMTIHEIKKTILVPCTFRKKYIKMKCHVKWPYNHSLHDNLH